CVWYESFVVDAAADCRDRHVGSRRQRQMCIGDSDDSAPAAAPSGQFSGGVIPLHEMERLMIIKGLDQTQGNRTQAAELLGISVRTLRNKLNEYREQGRPVDSN
ncbi:hypothetical protein DWB61_17620, partial [Ancylomarina euxinus]